MGPSCHFGSRPFDRGSFTFLAQCPSGECLAVGGHWSLTPSALPRVDGWWLLYGLLLTAFGAGAIVEWHLRRAGSWVRELWKGLVRRQVSAWERLASRAVRFIRKRRLVGIAFSNYRQYSLRNTESSKPTSLRRRRLATPGPKARTRTGPVIPPRPNGSDGSGTQRSHGSSSSQ